MNHTYICVDLETSGYIPGRHSILSIGAVAVREHKLETVGEFTINLSEPPGRVRDPGTMEWWGAQEPSSWIATIRDRHDHVEGIRSFAGWVRSLGGVPIAVMRPASFDWPFLADYFYNFCERLQKDGFSANPFEFEGKCRTRDIATLAEFVLGKEVPSAEWPEHWRDEKLPKTHIAIDDARLLAHQFVAIAMDIRDMQWRLDTVLPAFKEANESIPKLRNVAAHALSELMRERKFHNCEETGQVYASANSVVSIDEIIMRNIVPEGDNS